MSQPLESPLASLRVLVTRPQAQARAFAKLLQAAGGVAIELPAIEITSLPVGHDVIVPDKRRQFAIFISQNAVNHGKQLINLLPASTSLLAIGAKTAARMRSLGLNVALVPPQDYTSEALLALTELQSLDDTHVTIFRGQGGRTYLAEELERRGASVTCIDLYHRSLPFYTRATLQRCLVDSAPQIITITSVETLRNFLTITDKLPRFNPRALPVIAGSARIASAIADCGFTTAPWIATDPTDESMLQALCQWKQHENALP